MTLRDRPCSLVVTLEFPTDAQARGFERYLSAFARFAAQIPATSSNISATRV